jgi:hypothetical protein
MISKKRPLEPREFAADRHAWELAGENLFLAFT